MDAAEHLSTRDVPVADVSAWPSPCASFPPPPLSSRQGTTGVHIVLDPQTVDLTEACSCFDLRLPFADLPPRYGTACKCVYMGIYMGMQPCVRPDPTQLSRHPAQSR